MSEPGMLFLAAVLYVLIAICIRTIIWIVSIQIDGIRSASWPVTTGTVIASQVKRDADENGVSYRPEVCYEYEVDHIRYEGYRITYDGRGLLECIFESGKDYARNKVTKYPVGREVQVSYKPKKPQVATLETTPPEIFSTLSQVAIFGGIAYWLWLHSPAVETVWDGLRSPAVAPALWSLAATVKDLAASLIYGHAFIGLALLSGLGLIFLYSFSQARRGNSEALVALPYSRYGPLFIRSWRRGVRRDSGGFGGHHYRVETLVGGGLTRISLFPSLFPPLPGPNQLPFDLEELKTLFGAAAEPFLRHGQVNAEPYGARLYFEYIGLKYKKQVLGWLATLVRHYGGIVELGGQAVPYLWSIGSDVDHPLRPLAIRLLKDIGHSSRKRLGVYRLDDLLCPHCLARFTRRRLRLSPLERISIDGCQSCCQNKEFSELKRRELVVVLDKRMTKRSEWGEKAVRINGLQRQPAVDFDRVEIGQASDEEVERFVVRLRNVKDSARARRYRRIPCTVAAECRLSENTERILAKTFLIDQRLIGQHLEISFR